MRMPRAVVLLLALVLGAASSLLVACGESDNPRLIAPSRADSLKSALDDLQSSVDAGECQDVEAGLRKVSDRIEELPSQTDPRIVARLREGLATLQEQAPGDCAKATTETTPTVTETTPTETTPTETTTTTTPTETTTTTTPTTTTTTPTTTTPTTTTPTPTTPSSGGATPTTP